MRQGGWMTALALGFSLGAQEPAFRPQDDLRVLRRDTGTEETSFRWGTHRVTFITYARERLASLCQIRNARGKVVREVQAPRFVTPSLGRTWQNFLRDVNGDGREDLLLCAWSGGAYGSYVDYIFATSDQGTVQNLLIHPGGEYCLFKFEDGAVGEAAQRRAIQDLDGDGPPELVLDDAHLQPLALATHGPTLARVLAWNGVRFVEATRRFPQIPRNRAMAHRPDVVFNAPTFDHHLDLTAADAATGYYANAILAGEEAEARQWLLRVGGAHAETWLATFGPRIHRVLQGLDASPKQSSARMLRAF